MNDPTWKTIGILGGMGPEATAELYKRIVEICQRDYGAKYDSDFPPIFIYNMPLPDIVENKVDSELISSYVEDGFRKLEEVGCELISVPCNTVFAYADMEPSINLLDIVKETANFIRIKKLKRIGLLATRNTIQNKLYESALEGIEVLQIPEDSQIQVNDIVMRILSGEKIYEDKQRLISFIKDLAADGAGAVVLGCTELPLLISTDDSEIFLIDTLQILAEATVKNARETRRLK